MGQQQLSQYKVNLHILSPIHVGTGQELEPFSYVIRGKGLFLINLIKWMEQYPEKDNLERMMDSDNFANIRSFIAERFDLESAVLCSIPVDNPKLLDTYEKAIKERDPRNQVLISPTMRNEVTMEAFIPGSSIKGSIRTAIANRFVKVAGVTSEDSRGRSDYNNKIFGAINKDPMRSLKLSDVPLGKSSTVIVESKEFPLNPKKPLTPKGHMEVALSLSHTGETFEYPLRLSLVPFELHSTKIDLRFLVESLYNFYVPKYEEEYTKFYKSKGYDDIQDGITPMNNVVSSLKTNEALVRIGHFSHVECVTLDKVRKPKTRMGKDRKPLPWGKTRTLANGIYPFGWAKLEFLDLEAKPRPKKDWPFTINGKATVSGRFMPEKLKFRAGPAVDTVKQEKKKPVVQITLSPMEKLLKESSLIKSNDMGRIGTVIQKIDTLKTDAEKGELAATIKEKIGPKTFKKHKQKEYLLELISKAKQK